MPTNSPIPASELILNNDNSIYHLKLRPEHIAETILAVGDPSRVHKISQYFDRTDFQISNREFVTHTGTYRGRKVTAISTGIGTGNVEIFMNEIDALVNVNLKNRSINPGLKRLKIIRVGTSGTLRGDIPLGSYLVSDFAIGFDTLMSFHDLQYLASEIEIAHSIQKHLALPFLPYCVKCDEQLKRQICFDMIEGNTITCPGFYAPQGRMLRLSLKFPDLLESLISFHHKNTRLTNIEMETAAYYALGRLMGHQVLSVNAILANRANHTFSADPDAVVDGLIRKVLARI